MTDILHHESADGRLKAAHAAMWAFGDYPSVAHELIPTLGATLVDACSVRPGQRVLDLAAGAGNAAVPAAGTGAHVVASDLCPELLASGRATTDGRHDLDLTWQVADAEALPFADADFDVVMSCVGVMFAPHHQVAADEMLRVCLPGGTLGLVAWTPEGFIGEMFAAMKPYAPAPPPGAQPPPLWGDPDHVAGLVGDRVGSVRFDRRTVVVDRFADGAAFRDYFKQNYGPTIAVYRSLGEDADRVAALDAALEDLGRRHDRGDGSMEWEYLLWTASRS